MRLPARTPEQFPANPTNIGCFMNIGNHTFSEFKAMAERFHGYAAPGLLLGGYMVALAQRHLPEGTLFEAVSETRKCLPDAVQLLSLCSMGNNWVKVRDIGRYAVTLYDKYTGRGVRVSVDVEKLKAFPEYYSWLMKNFRLGLGSLIADDMGLGKTLQVITALDELKREGELKTGKVIAVVPATLLTNWVREIRKFAPNLTAEIYHGSDRKLGDPDKRPDVLLTTYGTLRRDSEQLSKLSWRVMVMDEAQAVKNTGTGAYAAASSFPADRVIAMTGTPVENRLMEYWSIFSIVQPGLLGTASDFRENFSVPIENEHDPRAAEAFRKLVAPFMLRRMKTDKAIISDLPDCIVQDVMTTLLPEQAYLYQETLTRNLDAISRAEANSRDKQVKRRALVLKLITELKQICNSPSQYNKQWSETPDSAKAETLFELLDECRENGRKVLVFTQYREMGELLQGWIAKKTGRKPEFLHGGVSVARRAVMVDDFQNNPDSHILLVSLKAGGTGLNLTAASVVIHYDLWWNPAVESQASDRAWRIGQQRDVLVYRFVTEGTFEERINEMLTEKRRITDLAVSSGENWVGDMSTSELRALFSLS